MAHLHGWRRLGSPAVESVDELAKLEQIAELAERGCVITIVMERRRVDVGRSPIGPRRWNERPAAVRQNDENEENAASLDGVNHAECPAFEGVAPPDNGHLDWNISVMGSVAPLPSIESITSACSTASVSGWRIVGWSLWCA
jgi:hypothetical protein